MITWSKMSQTQHPKDEEIYEVLKKEGLEDLYDLIMKYKDVAELLLKEILSNKDEVKNMIDTLKKEGLEDFLKDVIMAYNPRAIFERIIKTKHALKRIIDKYEQGNNKVAFDKANNKNTIVAIKFRTKKEMEEFERLAIEMDDLRNGKEPEALEMTYEEFAQRFKPRMIWYKRIGSEKKDTYSALMGGYRFAKNYKVVILPIPFINDEDVLIASKLSKNVYPLSFSDHEDLLPRGLIIFIPR